MDFKHLQRLYSKIRQDRLAKRFIPASILKKFHIELNKGKLIFTRKKDL